MSDYKLRSRSKSTSHSNPVANSTTIEPGTTPLPFIQTPKTLRSPPIPIQVFIRSNTQPEHTGISNQPASPAVPSRPEEEVNQDHQHENPPPAQENTTGTTDQETKYSQPHQGPHTVNPHQGPHLRTLPRQSDHQRSRP